MEKGEHQAHLPPLQRIYVWFPVPMWRLTTSTPAHSPSSDALFWLVSTAPTYTSTHIHCKKTSLKEVCMQYKMIKQTPYNTLIKLHSGREKERVGRDAQSSLQAAQCCGQCCGQVPSHLLDIREREVHGSGSKMWPICLAVCVFGRQGASA